VKISEKNFYKTVSNRGENLLIEKKSKFIADVKPVDNEQDALEFLNEIRSKYPDATHHVYAYVIDENNIFRYSDDGEPQGTAGMPVLDTIRKEGIVDVIVVVTRYFGGTLLGTGGLVHMYGASARSGLEAAGIVTRILCDVVEINVDYSLVGKMQYKIASDKLILDDAVYGNEVLFYLCLEQEKTQSILNEITDLTSGRAVYKIKGSKYIDLKEKEK
jgi:uncharacterized YigZ family protein